MEEAAAKSRLVWWAKAARAKRHDKVFRWNFYRLRRPNNRVNDENFPAKASVDYDDDTSTFIRIANWLIQSLNSPRFSLLFMCARRSERKSFQCGAEIPSIESTSRRRIGEDKSGEKWDLMISSTLYFLPVAHGSGRMCELFRVYRGILFMLDERGNERNPMNKIFKQWMMIRLNNDGDCFPLSLGSALLRVGVCRAWTRIYADEREDEAGERWMWYNNMIKEQHEGESGSNFLPFKYRFFLSKLGEEPTIKILTRHVTLRQNKLMILTVLIRYKSWQSQKFSLFRVFSCFLSECVFFCLLLTSFTFYAHKFCDENFSLLSSFARYLQHRRNEQHTTTVDYACRMAEYLRAMLFGMGKLKNSRKSSRFIY